MIHHESIRRALVDYVLGETTARKRRRIEVHLQRCRSCQETARGILETSNLLRSGARLPSDARSEEFWGGFADAVDRRIAQQRAGRVVRPVQSLAGRQFFPALRWRPLVAGAAAGLALAASFLVAVRPGDGTRPSTAGDAATRSQNDQPLMEQYLRRSKTLLVGLSNMNTEGERTLDLSAERKTSRELLREARYIRQKPLDQRSYRLIDDLDKIMLQVANFGPDHAAPDVELVRGGIRQENLLFKVRMAQRRFRNTPY